MAEIVEKNSVTGTGQAWPEELRLAQDKKTLTVTFDNGKSFALAAEFLRVESPSAEVQGHSPAERKYIGGKKDVSILGLEPVGQYAVRILFDDMHSTGLYSWDYLYALGENQSSLWEAYCNGLAAAGGRR